MLDDVSDKAMMNFDSIGEYIGNDDWFEHHQKIKACLDSPHCPDMHCGFGPKVISNASMQLF